MTCVGCAVVVGILGEAGQGPMIATHLCVYQDRVSLKVSNNLCVRSEYKNLLVLIKTTLLLQYHCSISVESNGQTFAHPVILLPKDNPMRNDDDKALLL